jgi:hypothetical protein
MPTGSSEEVSSASPNSPRRCGGARGGASRIPPEQASLNTVIIDGTLPDDVIRDMIEDSYDLLVSKLPRARRRALGWLGEPS